MNKYRIEDNFQVLQTLGKGAFSTVYKVRRFADNEFYALKRVTFKSLKVKEVQNALNEIRILASVKHPNIVGFRESFIDLLSEDLCIVMNYAGGGDLSSKIKECSEKKVRLPENLVIRFFYQLTSALYELHIRNVIHRDLKTANIFLSEDLRNVILGDMNVSKIVKNIFAYTQTGTPYYASPEVWRDEAYTIKTDVWSMGCVIYEMCMLKPPFNATDMDGLFEKVQRCEFDPFDGFYSKPLRDSILRLMNPNPEGRPNCERILNFSIFSDLKVLLGDSSASQAPPDCFHYSTNHLLETIKPSKDFKDLEHHLPPSQYSFDLKHFEDFRKQFGEESTRQMMLKNDSAKLARRLQEDCFAKPKPSEANATRKAKRSKSPDDLRANKSQLNNKNQSACNELRKSDIQRASQKQDRVQREKNGSRENQSKMESSLQRQSGKTAADRNESRDKHSYAIQRPIKSSMICDIGDILRNRKNKVEWITINTINSHSAEQQQAPEKHLLESQMKSLMRGQQHNQVVSPPEDYYGLKNPECKVENNERGDKPYKSKKTLSNPHLHLDHEDPLQMAQSRNHDNKLSKQLLKNKKKMNSAKASQGNQQRSEQAVVLKKENTEKELLEHFANQQRTDSNPHRLGTLKSKSPEFKLRKQTTDKLQTSQKEPMCRKRSSSRKPSRADVDLAKKAVLHNHLNSQSRIDRSHVSHCLALKSRVHHDPSFKHFDQNLTELNKALKSHCNNRQFDEASRVQATADRDKSSETRLANQTGSKVNLSRKFRVKSSKDRMQVFLNAKMPTELGNKSDVAVEHALVQKKATHQEEQLAELKLQKLGSLSNAALVLKKRQDAGDKLPQIYSFSKKTIQDSVDLKGGVGDKNQRNKGKRAEHEKGGEPRTVELEFKVRVEPDCKKQESLLPKKAVNNQGTLLDKSNRFSKREQKETSAEESVPLKLRQKRTSSAGVCKLRVDLNVKKSRVLSTNPASGVNRNAGKFVIRKKNDLCPKEGPKSNCRNDKQKEVCRQQASQQTLQVGSLGEFIQKSQQQKGTSGGNNEMLKSNLLKKKPIKS